MLRITDLKIDIRSLGDKLLLVDVRPNYAYVNNTKTDTVLGYRYTVALPAHDLEKISIKIPGKKLMDKPDGCVEVTFDGLQIGTYWHAGNVNLTASATGIKSV